MFRRWFWQARLHIERCAPLYLVLVFTYIAGFSAGWSLTRYLTPALAVVEVKSPLTYVLGAMWVQVRAILIIGLCGLSVACIPFAMIMLLIQGALYGVMVGDWATWGALRCTGMMLFGLLPHQLLSAPLILGAAALSIELAWASRPGTNALPKLELGRRRSVLLYRLLRFMVFLVPAMLWEGLMLPILQGWLLK